MGAVIQLIRAGDVIPHILEVITPAPEAKMPSVPYKWSATHVDVMLLDAESDEIVREKTITAFFTQLGVDKLSAGNVRRMVKAGYASIPAILRMTKADMLTIPGFKEKLATCVYTSIHDKLDKVQLPRLMAATNLFGRGMGEKRIVRVIEVFPHIITSTESENEKIKKVSSIKGFATKTAEAFVRHIPAFLKFIKETGLEKKLRIKAKSIDTSHPLYNKNILLTGFRDTALEEKIKEAGGKIASSVSKNTNLVLVKDLDEDTGKAEKARALGVTLMLRDVFIKKYAIQL